MNQLQYLFVGAFTENVVVDTLFTKGVKTVQTLGRLES